MTIKIDIQGIPEVKKFLKEKNIEALKKVDEGVDKGALFLLGEVKKSIAGQAAEKRSVDTGRFLNSVKKDKEKKLQAEVSSGVEYADHLEYGTSRLAPRRHFRNSADRSKPKIKQIIQSELKSL